MKRISGVIAATPVPVKRDLSMDLTRLIEHCAWLLDQGLAEYDSATDAEALAAFEALARLEGILPALESAHALAWVLREGPRLGRDAVVVVNLSGRGDKDVAEVLRVTGRAGDGA